MTALQQQVDQDSKQLLKEAAERQEEALALPAKRQKTALASAATEAAESELAQRIERNMVEIIRLSDEKINRAQQIYDYIDQHIRKLDKDLRSFDAEVAKERQRLGLPPIVPEAEVAVVPAGVAEGTRRKRGRGAIGRAAGTINEPATVPTSEELYQQALSVADPTEPKYCYCNRISFGEMIACEHPDCPIEWFHFECVGLNSENRPKGKSHSALCKTKALFLGTICDHASFARTTSSGPLCVVEGGSLCIVWISYKISFT